MKEEFRNRIILFCKDLSHGGCLKECIFMQQLRCLFTSYCILFDILVDTEESDTLLDILYDNMDETIDAGDFTDFMLQHLV